MSPPKEPMNAKAHARCAQALERSEDAFHAFYRLRDLIETNDAADVLRVHCEISTIHTWAEDFMRAMVGLAEEDGSE